MGSFGGKGVIPPYRDTAGTEPNITDGLLDALWNELEPQGPRVPLTKDGKTFAEAAELGHKLIWLHTYAERFRGEDLGEDMPQAKANNGQGWSRNWKGPSTR